MNDIKVINITLHGPREEAHKREEAYKRAFTSAGIEKVQVASVQGRVRPREAAKAGLGAYVSISQRQRPETREHLADLCGSCGISCGCGAVGISCRSRVDMRNVRKWIWEGQSHLRRRLSASICQPFLFGGVV